VPFGSRNFAVYALLAAVWGVVVVWQGEEHFRVRRAAKAELSGRSKDVANTISACIRGMRFHGRGPVLQERLESVLGELITGRTNELVKASELISIVLLNASGEQVVSAGRPIDFSQKELLQSGERWAAKTVVFVNPVDLGASLSQAGSTNPTVVLPMPPRNYTNRFPEGPRNRAGPPVGPGSEAGPPDRPPPDGLGSDTNRAAFAGPPPGPEGPPPPPRGLFRPRRPFWFREMSESDYESLLQRHALHGLALAMSTDSLRAASIHDFWLRLIIVFLATVSAFGSGLAWRNLIRSSDLQIRLVRASELNTHLKEMNLAAAGLAHETRNPLNIIRGLAQLISKQPESVTEIRQKACEIVDEADKVAAQLNEFINYSRPREVRRSPLALGSVISEVVRALGYDIEEKKVKLEVRGEQITIEADERLLRQAVFNLLLNAIQVVGSGGEIRIVAAKRSASEAVLEVHDNGPGVPPERRSEIFKPYFTTQKTGTGLGLAVVQQIVLAHGWDIECLPNQPKGATFRISHIRMV